MRMLGSPHDGDAGRRIVLVTGVARSGTSALVRTLNAHPDVCIGMERYKYRILAHQIEPGLFERERFFAFSPEDTNLLPSRAYNWAQLYTDLERRWDSARVVGDKVPQSFRMMDEFHAVYPHATFVYIVRRIEDVASSWNARALDPGDIWPSRSDFREAVSTWNEGNRLVLREIEARPGTVAVVDYERFFGGEQGQLARLCEWLGIEAHPQLEAMMESRVRQYHLEVRDKQRMVLPGQSAYVREHADPDLYRSVLTVAG